MANTNQRIGGSAWAHGLPMASAGSRPAMTYRSGIAPVEGEPLAEIRRQEGGTTKLAILRAARWCSRSSSARQGLEEVYFGAPRRSPTGRNRGCRKVSSTCLDHRAGRVCGIRKEAQGSALDFLDLPVSGNAKVIKAGQDFGGRVRYEALVSPGAAADRVSAQACLMWAKCANSRRRKDRKK